MLGTFRKTNREIQYLVKSKIKKIWGTLHEGLSTCTLLTAVRNILYLDNSAKGNHCCRSMTKLDGFILQKSTFSSTTQKENIVTFRKRSRRNVRSRVPYRSCTILPSTAVSFC